MLSWIWGRLMRGIILGTQVKMMKTGWQMPYSLDADEEREHARDRGTKYIQSRKTIKEKADDSDKEHGDARTATDGRDYHTGNANKTHMNESGKVTSYEYDYIDLPDPWSYVDTSGGSDANDVMRHKSSKKFYGLSTQMEDFRLDLKFKDLKMFKNKLVEFSTRKGFEFM